MSAGLEVADVFRRHGEAYRRAHDAHLGRVERWSEPSGRWPSIARTHYSPARTMALHTAHLIMLLIGRVDFAGVRQVAGVVIGAHRLGGVSHLDRDRLAE